MSTMVQLRRHVWILALGTPLLLAVTTCWDDAFGRDDASLDADADDETVADADGEIVADADGTLSFTIPADGAEIAEPVTLSVSGPGLARAFFAVDTQTVLEDTEAPFEFTFEPTSYVLGEHELRITGITELEDQEARVRTITVVRAESAEAILAAIDALEGGSWYELPQTRLRNVGWDVPEDFRGALRDIIEEASGGAYDTTRDRLMIFGGGQSYSGNEVYAFDLETAAWLRLTDPTPPDPDDPGNLQRAVAYPDGTPYARHTYDYLEYLPPPIDRLFCGGGTSVWPQGNLADSQTWFFDPAELTWEAVNASQPAVGFGAVTALDSEGQLWQHGSGSPSLLAVFDPEARTWTERADFPDYFEPRFTAAIETSRNLLVAVGNGMTFVWDLAEPDEPPVELETSGATVIETRQSPGLAYHPGSERLVAWSGGPNVYSLDLDAATWNLIESTGSVDPGPATERGVFGRFRYVPSRDVFILVTSVDRNVFVYRLSD